MRPTDPVGRLAKGPEPYLAAPPSLVQPTGIGVNK
jgi:hypothetical protein